MSLRDSAAPEVDTPSNDALIRRVTYVAYDAVVCVCTVGLYVPYDGMGLAGAYLFLAP